MSVYRSGKSGAGSKWRGEFTHPVTKERVRAPHLFATKAEGIECLWDLSRPLLADPPPVRIYQPGTWGPNAIHQLIAPNAWRLPFERTWRDPNVHGV